MEMTEDQYASIGRRTLALFIDTLILVPVCAVAGQILPIFGALIILFLYAPLMESSQLQATLGKHWMGIEVVSVDGRRITIQAALLRNILKFVSASLLLIGFIIAIFSERKQTLHDLLAQTVVVYGRNEIPITQAGVYAAKETWAKISDGLDRSSAGTTRSKLDQLERLQALREKGVLTDAEFESEKRKILG